MEIQKDARLVCASYDKSLENFDKREIQSINLDYVGAGDNVSKLSQFAALVKRHKILFPLRSVNCPSIQGEEQSLKWMGITPLDMIKQVVLLTVKSPSFPSVISSSAEMQDGLFFLRFLSDEIRSTPKFNAIHAYQKRKRKQLDDNSDDEEENNMVLGTGFFNICNKFDSTLPDTLFKPWNLSSDIDFWERSRTVVNSDSYQKYDNQHLAGQVKYLQDIIKKFERLAIESRHFSCIPSYNRVQSLFASDLFSLKVGEGVSRVILQSVTQMQALMKMFDSSDINNVDSKLSFKSDTLSCQGLTLSTAQCPTLSIMSMYPLPTKQYLQSEKEKKILFGKYMTQWLCQSRNWVNPYPDEIALHQMATNFIRLDCIPGMNHDEISINVAIEKINYWLVNVRTRKWHPAIKRAFDAKRPAMLLLEDSIRIFEKKDLRPVVGWNGKEQFFHRDCYVDPVAASGRSDSNNIKHNKVFSHHKLPSHSKKLNNFRSGNNSPVSDETASIFPILQLEDRSTSAESLSLDDL